MVDYCNMLKRLKKLFKRGIETAYISPDDALINQLHRRYHDSPSQQQEINKHQKIFLRRDDPNYSKNMDEIWSEF